MRTKLTLLCSLIADPAWAFRPDPTWLYENEGGGGGFGAFLILIVALLLLSMAFFSAKDAFDKTEIGKEHEKRAKAKSRSKREKAEYAKQREEEADIAYWESRTYEDVLRETEWYRNQKDKYSPEVLDIEHNLGMHNRVRAKYGFPPIEVPAGGHIAYGKLRPRSGERAFKDFKAAFMNMPL